MTEERPYCPDIDDEYAQEGEDDSLDWEWNVYFGDEEDEDELFYS